LGDGALQRLTLDPVIIELFFEDLHFGLLFDEDALDFWGTLLTESAVVLQNPICSRCTSCGLLRTGRGRPRWLWAARTRSWFLIEKRAPFLLSSALPLTVPSRTAGSKSLEHGVLELLVEYSARNRAEGCSRAHIEGLQPSQSPSSPCSFL